MTGASGMAPHVLYGGAGGITMKNRSRAKLQLNRETIRTLHADALDRAVGGDWVTFVTQCQNTCRPSDKCTIGPSEVLCTVATCKYGV
jgi:hypothetical protein